MSITTYSELQTAMGNWLNRSDLTALLPDFIMLFETRMNRLLRVPQMETQTTLIAESEELGLPTDFLELRELRAGGVLVPFHPPQELRELYRQNNGASPLGYSIVGSTLILQPEPSEAQIDITYWKKIPALASNGTNWLLTEYPDAYLYGSLCMAEAYLKDDDRVAVWKGAWDEAVAEIRKSGSKHRVGPLPATRPAVIE